MSDPRPARSHESPPTPLGVSASRPKTWAFRSVALLIVLLIAESALQAGIRFLPAMRDRLLPSWDLRLRQLLPDSELVLIGNPYWPGHDARGFRNPRASREARIVALGDSMTYGQGADRDRSWPAQLARLTGRDVYNMGIGGWGPVQALLQLDLALSLDPEAIVFAFYLGNDLYDAYAAIYEHHALADLRDPERARRFAEMRGVASIRDQITLGYVPIPDVTSPSPTGPPPPFVRAWCSQNVALYALARTAWNTLRPAPRPALAQPADRQEEWRYRTEYVRNNEPDWMVYDKGPVRTILAPGPRGIAMNLGDPRIEEGLRLCGRAIGRIQDRCDRAGVSFHVVMIPTKELVFASFVGDADESLELGRLIRTESEIRARLFDELEGLGVPLVDALPALREGVRTGRALYPPTVDGHPNGAGYRVIAEVVHTVLEQRNTPDRR